LDDRIFIGKRLVNSAQPSTEPGRPPYHQLQTLQAVAKLNSN